MFDGHSVREIAPDERRARIRLARTPRLGPISFHQALSHFGSARAACRELNAVPDRHTEVEEQALGALGGRFLVFGDADYPASLAAIPDAPPVLSAIGDTRLLAQATIAVVGARNASLVGHRLAKEFAAGLGAAGFAIASGLARGIDTAAHEASLPTGTIAVLAGGIDRIYPPQNAELQAKIASHGLLLSESPLGTPPVARAFPRRNRIVSGLSLGVVVIEAAARSGSLITAQRAAEQGREVFVVPGSPVDPRYEGSNDLIRDGATLVCRINDIVSVFGQPQPIRQPTEKPPQKAYDRDTAKVIEALGPTPTAVDELVRRCQVSAATVAEALLALELEGRLERHRGNCVSLI